MGTSAGRINAQLKTIEQTLNNTELGYWLGRLKERFLAGERFVVDDDPRNRGPRCELVRCGLIQLVKEGIVCPLLDQLRSLRESWKRRTRKRRNIQAAQKAQLLLFEPAEISEQRVSSPGVTSSPQQQRRSERQARKPRQRGLIRRIRKWEAERRDTKSTEKSPALSISTTTERCADKTPESSPEVRELLADFRINVDQTTIDNAQKLIAIAGPQAKSYIAKAVARNIQPYPVSYALRIATNASQRHHEPHRTARHQRRDEEPVPKSEQRLRWDRLDKSEQGELLARLHRRFRAQLSEPIQLVIDGRTQPQEWMLEEMLKGKEAHRVSVEQ